MSHSGSAEKQEPQGNTAALRTWPADSQAAPAEGNMGAAPSVEIPGGGQEGYNVLKVRACFREQQGNIVGETAAEDALPAQVERDEVWLYTRNIESTLSYKLRLI